MKVVLVGYMGSGKSLVGSMLAAKFNLNYIDLDTLIVQTEQLSIVDIFKQKGEIYFRKLENKLFIAAVNSKNNFVLSCGGGTPCYYNNHLLLQQESVISIYLKTTVEILFERISIEKKTRPVLQQIDDLELKEYIAKHLFERNYYYSFAKHSITTNNKLPTTIVVEIEKLLA